MEEVLVGPVPVGINKFVLQANAPDFNKIKNEDLLGVTVCLVTCSYFEQEFVRIGYYVNNDYSEPYDPETPPNPIEITKLFRNLLANEPRVTRFPINWSGPAIPAAATAEDEIAAENDAEEDVNENEIVDFNEEIGEDDDDEEDDGDDMDEVS